MENPPSRDNIDGKAFGDGVGGSELPGVQCKKVEIFSPL
jgi:hypothetical protein